MALDYKTAVETMRHMTGTFPSNQEMREAVDRELRKLKHSKAVGLSRSAPDTYEEYADVRLRFWAGIDAAKPGADRTMVFPVYPVPPCPIAEAAFPASKPNTDHIWDMIVLAARASRYE